MHRKNLIAPLILLSSLALALAPAGCGDSPASQSTTSSGSGGNAGSSSSSGSGGSGGHAPTTPPPGIAFLDGSAIDITPDGSIALIEDFNTGDVFFYDTVTGDLELKTSVGDPAFDLATGISATGRVSANYGVPVTSGLWSEADGWMDVSDVYTDGCDTYRGGTFDISADGKVAVGLVWHGCYPEAFRWTDTGGAGTTTILQLLGSIDPNGGPTAPTNRATVVSDDGKIAAGFAQNGPIDRSPAIWNADGTGFLLDPTNMDTPGEVLSISADGSMVAGLRGDDGFAWTKDKGMVALERPPGAQPNDPTYPNAIAAGGQLIFGGCGNPFFTTPIAFVVTPSGESRALEEIAAANGITIPAGKTLTNVLAASTDGSIVVGTARDTTSKESAFVLRLPVSAYGLESP